jgi:chromosome segregation ATPase
LKEVDAGAERSQNAADHEHITRDLEAELRNLKQAYETLCSEKGKEVSQLTAERDFSRDQFKTLERDYADLLSYGNKKEAQAAEAAQKLQQNVQQLQVASQKKDGEIRRLRAQAKAAEAKRKLVEGKLQNVYFMPKEIGGEVEKCKDRQPDTSQKHKKDMSETHKKGCSEGPALRTETKNSSKQMLAEHGQPEASQKRKCVSFLSNVSVSFSKIRMAHTKPSYHYVIYLLFY